MQAAPDAAQVEVLDALRGCIDGRARLGGEQDAVAGVAVGCVAEPVDTAQVAAALKLAAVRGLTVVARGSGTRMTWGAAPRSVNLLLDLAGCNRVLEHAAGDLIVHAEAGARLEDVQAALASSGQRLAVDPPPAPGARRRGTLGGIIATGVSGPLRLAHGAVRDLLIGVTMVRADGRVAHAGGKVVKNVAGYDLGKLLTGSWGTLAVLTEATFRLHPVPPSSQWVTIAVPDHAAASARVQQVVHSQVVPAALELDRPGGPGTLAVQLAGTEAGVDARVAELVEVLATSGAAAAEVIAEAPSWWAQLPWSPGDVGLRLTHELTGLSVLLDEVDVAASEAGVPPVDVRGSAGVGLLHAGLRADPAQAAAVVKRLRERAALWAGDVVVLEAPAAVRAALDPWGPVRGLPLMRRIKNQFDPEQRLAPGRFVGGI